jgi:HK97 family phage major capsid protein
MSTTATITLDAFQKSVLPLLQSQYRSGPALADAIKAFAADTPIQDEHDNEVDIDTLVLKAPHIPADSAADLSAQRITKLVEQTLAKTATSKRGKVAVTGGDPRVDNQAKHGFGRLGEFALAVHKASAPGGVADPRLSTKAPTTYANEGAGGAGGFLVPEEWADRLWEIVLGDESILSRTNQIPTSRNSLSLPVSETTAWGTTGVQAYWMDEAQ